MTPSAAQATAVGFLGAGVVGTITSGAAALAATAGLAFNAAAHFSTIYIVREAAPIVQALLLMVLAVLLALAGLWDVHDVIGLCLEASSDLQLRPSHSRQTSMQSCGNGEVTATVTPRCDRSLRIRRRDLARFHFALDPFCIRDLGDTKIIGSLEVQPRTRIAAEESCQSHGCIGRDPASLANDVVDTRRGYV
jgi:hypothetical protein